MVDLLWAETARRRDRVARSVLRLDRRRQNEAECSSSLSCASLDGFEHVTIASSVSSIRLITACTRHQRRHGGDASPRHHGAQPLIPPGEESLPPTLKVPTPSAARALRRTAPPSSRFADVVCEAVFGHLMLAIAAGSLPPRSARRHGPLSCESARPLPTRFRRNSTTTALVYGSAVPTARGAVVNTESSVRRGGEDPRRDASAGRFDTRAARLCRGLRGEVELEHASSKTRRTLSRATAPGRARCSTITRRRRTSPPSPPLRPVQPRGDLLVHRRAHPASSMPTSMAASLNVAREVGMAAERGVPGAPRE